MDGVSYENGQYLFRELTKLDELLGPLREQAFHQASRSDTGLLELLSYYAPRTSFDIRPLFFVSAFQLGSRHTEPVLPIALALELTTISTLVADDILDESNRRDSFPCAHIVFGVGPTLVLIELLKSTASVLFLGALQRNRQLHHKYRAYRLFEEGYRDLYRGQFVDIRSSVPESVDEDLYFSMINLTTARMIQISLEMGALLGDVPPPIRRHLSCYGSSIGILHQLRDDLSDWWPAKYDLGRPMAEDLRERKLRLPIIHCLQNDSSRSRALRQILEKEQIGSADVLRVRQLLQQSGSFEYVAQHIRNLAERALSSLVSLPKGRSRHRLEAAARYFAEV